MSLFSFFHEKEKRTFDPTRVKPMIRASICTGEKVAGFKDLSTGSFEEVALIRSPGDLSAFKETYGIEGELEKFY